MTLKWTQGIKGFQFGFINDHVLCVRSGPTVRFQDLQSQVCNVFRLRTSNPTSLVVHPLEPYFAVFEVCQLNPKVFVYRYPNFEETILTGSGELELQQLVFSSSSYLATISGVPDFLLSLWDFKQNLLLCQAHLNSCALTTVSFCPLNWRLIVATDVRYIHVWYVETCNQITLLRSRSTLLPARSVQVGLYYDPSLKADPKQIEPCKDKNNLYPQLPESAISGVTEEKEPEYNDYMDDTDRVICVSQTWSNNELVFIGCKYGELLLVDPSSLSINVLLNPLSRRGLAHESTTDDPTSMTKTSEISISVCNQSEPQTQDASCGLSLPLKCLSFLIFAKQGLYSAGEDGTLRVIGLNSEKSRTPVTTKLPGLTLETQDSKAIPQHMCIRIVSCTKAFVFRNPFNSDGQNETLKITGMAVSPSYSLLALTARSGQMAILRLPEHKEDYGKHLDPQLCLATSGDAFTGFGVLGPDNKSICATSRMNGIVNTWDCHTGEMIGAIAIGEKCCCLTASPLIPVIAVGMYSGVALVFDCSNPSSMRLVQSIRLHKAPLSHMRFDSQGEVLVTAVDNEHSVILSGRPKKKFDPIGFVALTGSVQDLSLLRCDTERIFVLVATAHTPIGGATDLFFYEIRLSVLSNAPHAYLDSCRSLRPDVIRLMHLRFGRPMTSVCLWPPWSKEATTAPVAFAAESGVHQLHSFQLPEEYVYKPLPVPASTSSRVGFMGHSRHLAGSSISFHTSVAASSGLPTSTYTEQSGSLQYQSQPQVITHRRPSRRARAVTGVTLRLTPSATASISVPDAQDSTEDTAQTSQRSSILNPLKSYPLLRGSQCIRLTRIPGTDLLLVCYGDGVVEFIAITEDQLSVKKSVQLHENDQVGAVGVEFCGNFNSLISCGFDGLLMRTEIDMDFTAHPEWKLSLPDALLETAETESKELKTLPTHLVNCVNAGQKRTNDQPLSPRQDGQHNSNRPLFFRSSTAMTVADHSIGLHDSSESDSDALEVTPILSEPNRETWVEDCVKEARALEHQVYEEAQEQLRSELADIQNMINTMAAENEKLPEVQRISRQEFELDVEEQAAILEETENAVRQTRDEIELIDLANQFIRQVIKSRCWDDMLVKGRYLRAFSSSMEVSNFPLRARTQQEIDQLHTVKARRNIQLSVNRERAQLVDNLFFGSSVKAIQQEELEEDEERQADVNRVLAGSTAMDHGGRSELCYDQMDLYTREQKIYQIVLIQDNIYRVKEAFNRKFDEAYAKKEIGLDNICTRLARVRKILVDIQQATAAKAVVDPSFSPRERPEMLLSVDDSEITVERYLTPAELAAREARRLLEEERKRLEKLDNWRERGLEEMMGGVLEVRKEDELKKDVPKPAFLITAKPVSHWTPDERRLYAEYERKVQELNEEREKYRKFLEGEIKKMYTAIEEEKVKFDEQLVELFNEWIRVQIAVLQEELKIWRLKCMLLTEEEQLVHEQELHRMIENVQEEEKQVTRTLVAAKGFADQAQEAYENLCADDRILEKNFRKEFADVHGPLYEYITKAFKRRPRRVGQLTVTQNIDSDTVEQSEKSFGHVHNPYLEITSGKRQMIEDKTTLDEVFRELDVDPAREGQVGMDNIVWDRLCKYRRRKIEKEMEVKQYALKLADINTFVQRREEELISIRERLDSLRNQLAEHLKGCHRTQTDLELQLLLKQGQVEVDVREDEMVRDYSNAVLINGERVEELNKHIISLGESKVTHMIRSKEFKKRFYQLEWELRQMLMQYEDLQTKLGDIRKFTITKEVQKYLQISDYDGYINSQISTLEQTISLMRETHKKAMEQKRKRLRRYQIQRDNKLKPANAVAKTNLKELNVSLHETKFIYDQSRCVDTKTVQKIPRYKLLIQQQRLMRLVNEQASELKTLRSQVMQLKNCVDPVIR